MSTTPTCCAAVALPGRAGPAPAPLPGPGTPVLPGEPPRGDWPVESPGDGGTGWVVPDPGGAGWVAPGVGGAGWVVPDVGGVGWVVGTRPGFTGDAARGVPATVTP